MKVTVYTDGGSRGNPGVAGSGSVVYSEAGETLAEIAYVVGQKSSNNVAEYHGLLRGLEAARDLGATEVDVYMDSKLVVEQMSGRWKIKHPDMQELALAARALAGGFTSVTYTWVPRAKNKKADELSNVAMDAAAAGADPGIVGAAPATPKDFSPASLSDAPRTRFILLRHGQTQHSVEKVYSGSSDPALTEAGRQQAERAARALALLGPVDAIVSSPQARARETAEVCARELGVAEVSGNDGFREVDFGAFEGLTRDECVERYGEEFGAWEASISVAPPGGESLAALHRRVTRARLKLQEAHAGKTVLVVTHVTPIKSVLRQALGVGGEVFRHVFLDLAGVSVVDFYGDFGVVRCVNDVAHLR
ncbi:bifunctional RNase H/acid phosphatase [Corynebacterium liangguodongii]|uniref:Bifunctional RNase H/acid phosphatase n=1 Tax=Corynebacterium liangguodongii TaxID=2079535 RepID=A0A2S0WF47_9CORY|nr:bifunctional RNase H/acid phosphatase [Corynebacterium liangguodongii]AWB84413.1 bifunctional RNase H/acid phosphatase [Corynebacterium liangguodongii]PWB99903.1 bifunctional RNase H/acid phosphatase [Corynebacterium liangguodongii]